MKQLGEEVQEEEKEKYNRRKKIEGEDEAENKK